MSEYGIKRQLPPVVKQPVVYDVDLGGQTISNTCWAAALSSWIKATRNESYNVDYLLEYFKWYNSSKGLNLGSFDKIAEDLIVRMNYEKVEVQNFNFEYLYEKLLGNYLYVMKIGQGPAHAVVSYGVARDAETAANPEIRIMDPLKGRTAIGPISGFVKGYNLFYVGWSKT